MEDILALYSQPEDPKWLLIFMDEVPKQMLTGVQDPLPAQPGQPLRMDNEYQLNGVATCSCFLHPFYVNGRAGLPIAVLD